MPWFKKRKEQQTPGGQSRPSQRPVPSRAPSQRTPDWRSYDSIARDYARTHARNNSVVSADLVSVAEIANGHRVIDIGTGTGAALANLNSVVGETGIAVGIDPSVKMLQADHAAQVVAAEAINLPFHAETFDVALAAFSITHFRKLDTALYDIRRVLKRGGALAVAVWGEGEDDLSKTWRVLLEEAIGRDILQAGLKDEIPWGEQLSNKTNLETALRDAGFRPITIERREYRFEMTRDDYLLGLEIEAGGRYARAMLGESLWPSFRARAHATFAERFPSQLIDFRDVLIAKGGVPDNVGFAPVGYNRR